MVGVSFWFVETPDCGLFPIRIPSVFTTRSPTIQNWFVLPFVWGTDKDEGAHPEATTRQLEVCFHKCSTKVQTLSLPPRFVPPLVISFRFFVWFDRSNTCETKWHSRNRPGVNTLFESGFCARLAPLADLWTAVRDPRALPLRVCRSRIWEFVKL